MSTLGLLWTLALAAGVALGFLCGGRLRNLTEHRLRLPILLWVAFAVQVADFTFAGFGATLRAWHLPTLAVIYSLVLAWIVVNLPGHGPGLTIAGLLLLLGSLANAAVIAANGKMPGSYAAAVAAGVPRRLLATVPASPKHMWRNEATRLPWLGDNIPFRLARLAVSPGDVALMTGIVIAVAAGMRSRSRASAAADAR